MEFFDRFVDGFFSPNGSFSKCQRSAPANRLMLALNLAELNREGFWKIAEEHLEIKAPEEAKSVLSNIYTIVMYGDETEKSYLWFEDLLFEACMKNSDYNETALERLTSIIEGRSKNTPYGFVAGLR